MRYKDVDDRVGSQRVRMLMGKGYRAREMFGTWNSLQREPQRADLNTRRELNSQPPCPVFICHVGACGFNSRQSALIEWNYSFKTYYLALQ